VPPLELERSALSRLQDGLRADEAAAEGGTRALRADSDLLIDAFLKEERRGEAAAGLFRAGHAQLAALDAAVAAQRAEAAARGRRARRAGRAGPGPRAPCPLLPCARAAGRHLAVPAAGCR
jgi:hypothetical protein